MKALFASRSGRRLGYPHEVFDYSQSDAVGAISRSTVPSLDLFPEFGNLARSITAQHSDVVLYGHGCVTTYCVLCEIPMCWPPPEDMDFSVACEAASLLFRHGLRLSSYGLQFQATPRHSSIPCSGDSIGQSTKAADAARRNYRNGYQRNLLRSCDWWWIIEDFLDRRAGQTISLRSCYGHP